MARWTTTDGSIEHRQTIFVQQNKKTSGCILIKKSGEIIDNQQVVVETKFTDKKGRIIDITAPVEVMAEIVQHPEKFGHDGYTRNIRVKKVNRNDGKSAGYLSHKAAAYNFGEEVLPERYKVCTNNGNRFDVSAANQRIKGVNA